VLYRRFCNNQVRRAIFQISDRSQTLYKTVCITSWTECSFIQLYGIMLIKYTAAIRK